MNGEEEEEGLSRARESAPLALHDLQSGISCGRFCLMSNEHIALMDTELQRSGYASGRQGEDEKIGTDKGPVAHSVVRR